MESVLQSPRRLKSASGIEGTNQVQKHNSVTRFSPEYRCYVSEDDNMFTLEFGESPSRRVTGRPMRKLLEEEMSKEVEPKRRTSIFARLMSFERLSSPWRHRQPKSLSDRCQQKNVPMSIQPDRQTYAGQCNRGVYQDADRRYSSRWSANSLLSKHEMALIQQNYGNGKNRSIDERRDGSTELDVNPNHPRGGHIADLEPFNSAKYEGKAKASERNISSHVEREDGLLLERYNSHRAHTSCQSSKIRLEEKKEKEIQRGDVFLLQTRHGYTQNHGISGSSSHDYSHGCDMGFSHTVSNKARTTAQGVVRELEGGSDETIDESPYDARESYFDSELFELSSKDSFGDDDNKGRGKNPSCSQAERSPNEAKERVTERWTITPKYRELEIVRENKTLGEMLALPDKQTRPKLLNAVRNDPSGISSRDGWKYEINKTSSRGKHETVAKEKDLVRFAPINLGSFKIAKRNQSYKNVSSSEDSKSKSKKPIHCEHIYSNEIGSSSKAKFEIEMEPKVKDVSHMYRMAAKDIGYKKPVSEVTNVLPKASQLVPKQPSPVVDNDKAAALDQKDSTLQESHKTSPEQGSSSLQCVLAEPNTSESSNAADHASPISVFETPLTEDASSGSESFERVNAEINELRMQLQLLKKESSSNADIEKEIGELYSKLSEGSYISGVEALEISYVLDVLVEAGLQETGFDTFITKWHSPDCPIDPLLFDDLEPRYSDENIELSQERRVIFDRINWVLLEIFDQNVDLSPWVMPKLWGLSCQKEKGANQSVENLIDQVFADEKITEKILGKEMLRPDFKEEIEEIGMKIEDLIMDEMISEFI